MAFLAWFGGAGYLLVTLGSLGAILVLPLAVVAGLAGASIVFLFLAKVLLRYDATMSASDYDPVGVLGRLSIGIREGGTGEIIFTQQGVRCASAARSEDGRETPRGTEVVITRYEKGIAYVKTWNELAEGAERGEMPEKMQ